MAEHVAKGERGKSRRVMREYLDGEYGGKRISRACFFAAHWKKSIGVKGLHVDFFAKAAPCILLL